MKHALIATRKDLTCSRRDVVQKLAGLAVAAGASTIALSPQKAEALVDEIGPDSIAGLRGLSGTPSEGSLAYLEGYYNAGDAGQGIFYWDPFSLENDNGGTIIKQTNVTNGRWKRIVDGLFNVKWFGAIGNGSTDDTSAIQNAINAAASQASTGNGSACVLFPGGKYCLNTLPSTTWRLNVGTGYSGKLHLRGDGEAILYTNGQNPNTYAYDVMLLIYGSNYHDILIENLTFQRAAGVPSTDTHTTWQTFAIAFNAPSGTILRPVIRNCTFQDFSVAVNLNYTEGALIIGCHWKYTNGNACGRNTLGGIPNVGLWAGSGGACIQTQVIDNYWSGTENMVSGAALPMDGFVYGISKGWTIKGNVVRRASFEAIYPDNGNDATATCTIEGNYIDNEMPAGYTLGSSVRQAIRADEYNILVANNNIRKSAVAIMVYNYPTVRTGGIITCNNITIDSGDATTPGIAGIVVDSRQDLLIQDNKVLFPAGCAGTEAAPVTGISIANSVDLRVLGNQIHANSTNPPSFTLCGIFLANGSAGTVISGNSFKNLGLGVVGQLTGSPNTYSQIRHNEYLNTKYPIGRYSGSGEAALTALGTAGGCETIVDLPLGTSPGWYRAFGATGYIGGTLSIAGILPLLGSYYEVLDGQFRLDYDYGGFPDGSLGAISQFCAGRSSKYVDQIRISSQYGGASIYLAVDVHVKTQLPSSGKVRFTFTHDTKDVDNTSINPYPDFYSFPIPALIPTLPDTAGYGYNLMTSLPSLPGILTTGRLYVGDGIGGNIITGAPAGGMNKKMPVYDESGSLAGYLPIYS